MFTLSKHVTITSIAALLGTGFISTAQAQVPPVMEYDIVINDAYADPFNSVLVDPYGNTLIVGHTPQRSEYIQTDTIMVAKHDAGGNLLWKDYTPRTSTHYSGNDQGIHSKLDSKGNLYILFWGGTNCGELVKFNHGGERTVISEPTGCMNPSLYIDDNDNLYVFDRGDMSKYSNDTLQWSSMFGTSRSYRGIKDIATDSAGDVYLYGNKWAGSTITPFMVKLDSEGNYQWETSFVSETTVTLRPEKVLIGLNDEVFAVAYDGGEVHLVKYNSDGTQIAHDKHLNPDINYYHGARSNIDGQGVITIFATTRPAVPTSSNHFDLLMLKYSDDTTLFHQKQIDFGYNETTTYNKIVQDGYSNNYVLMGGSVTKLDFMGETAWQTEVAPLTSYRDIVLGNDGKLVVGGYYSDFGFGSSNNYNLDAIAHTFDVSDPTACQ